MKILCVIDSLCSGGAQRQLVELALGFKDKGHEVNFLTYHHIPFYNQILEEAGISISCIMDNNYLVRLLKMRKFIRRGNYDSVLSFLSGSNFICEFAGLPYRKWRLVVGERNANPNIKTSIQKKILCWIHLLSDYVVSNSSVNMKMVRSVVPFLSDAKCKIIFNIINLNRWYPLQDYKPKKGGIIKLVIAARHHPQKNLFGTIDALSILKPEERKQLKVEWYGDDYEDSLKRATHKIKINGLGSVIKLFPATHDITNIIQNCDVVGLFSFYEGLPNFICEGMACAKPVVCTAVSDLPIFLDHQRFLFCDPNNPKSICESIRKLIHMNCNDLVAIGKENQRIASLYFVRDVVVCNYLELFKDKKTKYKI